MPRMDHEFVVLGHGSGGLLTYRLLDQFVFKALGSDSMKAAHDGALLNLSGKIAFTTDSFVVSPVFFPGGNIGDLAVNGTVNDLAMCGAIPESLSLSFILEEGLRMEEFWIILQSIKRACGEAGVEIVTGDTKVVEKGKGDQIFINTTGIGKLHHGANIHPQNIRKGDRIIASGCIATHGVAVLSVREGLTFETSLKSDSAPLHDVVLPMLDEYKCDVHLLRDPTRGGVASALNEVARSCGLGIQIDESALPLEDEVKGACEMLGLDPLYVANEGIFLAIVEGSQVDAMLELLHKLPKGQRAAVIGEVTEDHPGQVVLEGSVGGRRVVNMLTGDQLPRIC
ncbi:MAG: hydrogenase expression/formation protein HypE [Saprospiraceae bacterium]|nr:hydrogenase expression/formation protein HypE [Saprospiraceae bacterium]